VDDPIGAAKGFGKGLGQAATNTAALGFKLRDLIVGTPNAEGDPMRNMPIVGKALAQRGPMLRSIPGVGHAVKLGDAIQSGTDLKAAEEAYRPDPNRPAESTGAGVGEFAGNMAIGAVGGSGVARAVGKAGGGLVQKGGRFLLNELAENAAFTGQALQEGGDVEATKSAATDIAASMALRYGGKGAVQLGGKVVDMVKQSKAPNVAFTPIIESVSNEKGLIGALNKLPEVEDAEKLAPEMGVRRKSYAEIEADTPKSPKKPLLTNIEDADADMLQSPETRFDVPFTRYVEEAKRGVKNRRLPSAYDLAGTRATEALDAIGELKRSAGQLKESAMKAGEDVIIDIAPIKQKWQQLLADRFRAQIDEDGNIVPLLAGGSIREAGELSALRDVTQKIMSTQDEVFAIEADDLAANLRSILDNAKQSEFKKVNKSVEGAAKELRGDLKQVLNNALGSDYAEANHSYAKLIEYEKWLNSRLGQEVGTIVDPTTGEVSRIARHGGSLIKSVFSPADRGNKAMFEAIRQATGIDLVREATYAKLSMELVGDTRVNDLLRTTAQAGSAVKEFATGNKIGAAGKLIKGSKEALIGQDIERIVEFYRKAQGRAEKSGSAMQQLKDLGGSLGNQRGSISTAGESSASQTKTDNFKKWFGDWEKNPESASKVVDKGGNPLVVYHGTPDGRDIANSGTFKSQNERFGMGSDTHVHWFTDDVRTAKTYANPSRAFDYQGAEPGIVETYISLKNPLVIDGGGKNWREAQKIGKTGSAVSEAIENGHDGIIIKNVYDTYNTNPGGASKGSGKAKPITTYAVFSPNQIKSATSNSGEFSTKSRDIRGSAGPGALETLAGLSALGTAGVGAAHVIKKKNEREKNK
jgi:hypothetical protein